MRNGSCKNRDKDAVERRTSLLDQRLYLPSHCILDSVVVVNRVINTLTLLTSQTAFSLHSLVNSAELVY